MIARAFALALCLVALSLIGLAKADGPCPTTICSAAFGNVDCCKQSSFWPKFGPGARCQWYNNPVSFYNQGLCVEKSTKYMVLKPSNSQGPAGSNLCRCKDRFVAAAINLPAPNKPTSQVPGFTVMSMQDIVGNDIPCAGQSYCEVCGPPESLALACKNYNCKAFTYNGKCGYMKKANGPNKYREGWTKYTRN